jgi:hypothetical protein
MIGSLAVAVGLLAVLTIVPGPDVAVVARGGTRRRSALCRADGRRGGLRPARLGPARGRRARRGARCVGRSLCGRADRRDRLPDLARTADALAVPRRAVATPLDGRQAAVRPAPGVPRGDLVGVRRGDLAGDSPGGRRSLAREAWRTGFLTNLLNPKIGVFYTSVLLQLVPTGLPVAATQGGSRADPRGPIAALAQWLGPRARAVADRPAAPRCAPGGRTGRWRRAGRSRRGDRRPGTVSFADDRAPTIRGAG